MIGILGTLATIGSGIVTAASGLLAAACITYGAYSMWDINYIERNAFTSAEMSVYRPTEEEGYSLEELQEVNSDAVSWVQIPGTHVDYPVVQGKDDLYYAAHDVFGNTSVSGAIYLCAENSHDFSDQYNVIFGHHMDSGAMMGDIDKFADPGFFNEHKTGSIVLGDTLYDLDFFAFMRTNAYDQTVYNVRRYDTEPLSELEDYVRANSINYRDTSGSKIVAFSTGAEAETNGREILFAKIAPATQKLIIEDEKVPLASGMHKTKDPWAFLNLVCLIGTFITMFPVPGKIKRMKLLWKEWHKKDEEENLDLEEAEDSLDYLTFLDIKEMYPDETPSDAEKAKRKAKRRSVGIIVGFVLEVVLFVVGAWLFVHTENLLSRITMIDEWTVWMLLIFGTTFVMDAVMFRQKRLRKEPAEEYAEEIAEEDDVEYFDDDLDIEK